MMDIVKFSAGYQAPYFNRPPVLPWKIAQAECFESRFLHSDMTLEDMGLFVLALAQYGATDGTRISGMDKDEIVALIIGRRSLVIAGGIYVTKQGTDERIYPGCCAGLEEWRGWSDFLDGDCSPWMGHDPCPWLERVDQKTIRIWQDGGFDEADSKRQRKRGRSRIHCLELATATYAENMRRVERDLLGVLDLLKAWAEHEGIAEAERLVKVVDKAFNIRPEYMKADWWTQYSKLGS